MADTSTPSIKNCAAFPALNPAEAARNVCTLPSVLLKAAGDLQTDL
jgi:hypothetical protein